MEVEDFENTQRRPRAHDMCSFVSREFQTEARRRHYMVIRPATSALTAADAGSDVDHGRLLLGGVKNWSGSEDGLSVSLEAKHNSNYRVYQLLWWAFTKGAVNLMSTKICPGLHAMFTAALFLIAPKWRQTSCLYR